MFFIVFALFFFWLIFRELRSSKPKDNFSFGYMGVCLVFAALLLWQPFKYWLLERKMTAVVHELSGFKPTDVHCQTLGESLFDRTRIQWAGYTYFDTGNVVFKAGWCKTFKNYLSNPAAATQRERYSLTLLVHEAMHVRGEKNEKATECQAIQRHYRAALLLGIPEHIARDHGIRYFTKGFPRHPYYSPQCTPGGVLDEELHDSTWQFLTPPVSDTRA